jgi:hypothetical protein
MIATRCGLALSRGNENDCPGIGPDWRVYAAALRAPVRQATTTLRAKKASA